MDGSNHAASLSLGDYTLTVGAGGIGIDQYMSGASIGGGVYNYGRLSSDSGYIDFNLQKGGHVTMLNVSVGSSTHKVGMRVLGHSNKNTSSIYASSGVRIHGGLSLDSTLFFFYQEKSGVNGDVFLKKRSELKIQDANPLSRDTTVTLQDASILRFQSYYKSPNSSIKSLVVERGGGELWFEDNLGSFNTLFLDDLIISEGSSLRFSFNGPVSNLFVRKDSAHLYDSLSRIFF